MLLFLLQVAELASQVALVFVFNQWAIALSNICMGILSGCGRQPVK